VNKPLTELEKLDIEKKAKFALLRIEKHLADFTKNIRAEIEDVVRYVVKLQTNGVKKIQEKGGDE